MVRVCTRFTEHTFKATINIESKERESTHFADESLYNLLGLNPALMPASIVCYVQGKIGPEHKQ